MLLFLNTCQLSTQQDRSTQFLFTAGNFPYNLDESDTVFHLPDYLEEISGLDYIAGENRLACVQDENAIIYIFDIDAGKVISQHHFGRDGDYEGITLNGDTVFVLRSDGTIFQVRDFRSEDKTIERIDTPLSAANNAEGLFYDSKANRLFIACKDRAGISASKPLKGYKAVYSYDLNRQQFVEEPTWLISLDELENFADYSPYVAFSVKLGRRLGFLSDDTFFKPSGIAIHPVSDEVYIIAHIGKKLLVMSREGELRHLIQLDAQRFKQPEGIAFSPQADLYISNEGRGGKANIIRFNMINNENP